VIESNPDQTVTIDETFLMEKAKALQNKLMEFNVPIMIEGFDIGPSIVQIRIKPDEGIRLSTIESLSNDISLSLKSKSVRIVAPIPGTDCVGIQLPNPKPLMVHLGDIFNTTEFANDMKKSDNNLALGKAIDGTIIIKTLESMPHLLVAWATGSGKSVWVNDFILSLMYQNTPSELKFLMVDPKQVELELYAGLPYLLAPIVFEPEKALKLLKRTEHEMERRYGVLRESRVKNIDEYNKKWPAEKMFRIVFVVDELASMMLSKAKRDVESCITHISAKARAVGIHLIIATQRPSVDVITGLIKANMPTRIAFGTVSEIDSRTILGRKGAETLLGKWDMLYMDPSTKAPTRIQAPFVSTEEIEKVVMTLKTKYMGGLTEEDIYNQEIVGLLENKLEAGEQLFGSSNGDNDDELVERAIQVISQTRKASATLLQRKLGVGFARAARIMDILEEKGVIGPQDGAKPRDIFI
jgi:DNA segregation ATPase FtsK/SpoIIIE, S-DNA-T family